MNTDWTSYNIRFIEPEVLAKALLNDEVTLEHLKQFNEFKNKESKKESKTEEAVWKIANEDKKWQKYLDIYPNGNYADDARKKIKEAEGATGKANADNEAWNDAKSIDTISAYENYKSSFPEGRHIDEANRRIKELREKEKQSIISKLRENPNAYSLSIVKSCGISADDLKGIIPDDVLRSWDIQPKSLELGNSPDEIRQGCTEVYFWGNIGSGKTCTMGAILGQANRMGMYEPRGDGGSAYMSDLISVFQTDPNRPAICLPQGTPAETTQYLPLNLNKELDNNKFSTHELSIVELSGEIFKCIALDFERKIDSLDPSLTKTYQQLKNYLSNRTNPKYHFFIVDSDPKPDSEQARYLQEAATYFSDNNIFNETTQGINIIVTKCDTLSTDRSQWQTCAEQCVNNHYRSFKNTLSKIIGPDGLALNNGTVNILPMSIGQIYLQMLCVFDPETSEQIVNLLLQYSKGTENKQTFFQKFKKGLKK